MSNSKAVHLSTKRGFVSISNAAKFLKVSPDTLRNWEKQGKLIPDRTQGGARRYKLSELEILRKEINPVSEKRAVFLPISKAAKLIGVSPDTLRNWDKKGLLEAQRTDGGARRFSKTDLNRLKKEMDVKPAVPEVPAVSELYPQLSELVMQGETGKTFRHIKVISMGSVIALLIVFLGVAGNTLFGPDNSGSNQAVTEELATVEQNKQLEEKIQSMVGSIEGVQKSLYKIQSEEGLLEGEVIPGKEFRPKISLGGSVLGLATGAYLEINHDTLINGTLEAPNIVYNVVAGENVQVSGDPQRPTISAAVPDLTEVDTLASVTARGGTTSSALSLQGPVSFGNVTNLGNLSLEPGTAVNGATYYNTSSNKFRCYQNGAWKDCDTDTTGTPFGGLTLSASSGTDQDIADGDTITVAAGDGITTTAGSDDTVTIGLNLTTSGTTGSTSSNSGLEVTASGLTLLKGCADGELLKYTDAGGWACASDGGGGGSITVEEGDSAIDVTVTDFDFASGDFSVSEAPEDEVNISIDYVTSGITRTGQNETVTGNWAFNGDLTLGDASTDLLTISSTIQNFSGDSFAVLEGSAADGNELTLNVSNPATTDRTITFPDNDGTVAVAGSGVIAVGADGVISCATCLTSSSAVTSLTGTANQVLVNATSGTATTGAITLTLPQSIGTTSTPTFGGMTLNGALTLANLETLDNATNSTFTFGRNDAGIVTLTAKDDDAVAELSILPGGAAGLNLGGGSTTVVTLTTDGTGDGEVVLPGNSIGNAELVNSSLTVNTTSPLAGGGAVSLGGSLSLTCSTCLTSASGGAFALTLAGTTGTPQTIDAGDTITIAAGSGITTSAGSTDTITISSTLGTSISSSEVDNDTLDFAQLADSLTLDASTGIAFNNFNLSTSGTGDLTIGNTGGLTVSNTLTANGNTVLGNASSDTLTIDAATTVNTDFDYSLSGSENVAITSSSGSANTLAVSTTGVLTDGVTSLSIALTQADDADGNETNSALTISLTSLSDDADTLYGINIGDIAAGAATETAFRIGEDFDNLMEFEGSTADSVETFLRVTDPTSSDKIITFPNASGTVAVSASGPVALSAGGDISCPTCLTSGGAVASVTGTANQVLVNGTSGSAQTGAVTLTTPQDIGTGSSPTFNGLTLSGTLAANGDLITSDSNLVISATGYTKIGDGATGPGSASADDDLFVLGALEADGIIYADGGINCSDCISLGSETSGNYVSNVSAGLGIAVTGSAGEGWTPTVALDTSAALSGDHTLNTDEAKFGQSGLIFEGSTSDNFEAYLAVSDPGSDITYTFSGASGTVWTSGNDGASSTLDADLLDNIDSGSFLRSDASDSYTSGTLTFDAGTSLDINSTTVSIADTDIAFDGASTTFTVTGALNVNTGGTIIVGDGGDGITLNANGIITVQDAVLSFDSQATDLEIRDNAASAFTISESADNYLSVTTTDNSESLTLGNSLTNLSVTIDKGSSGNVVLPDFTSCTALETDISGNLTCGADAGGNTAWDDIGDPDANSSINMAQYSTSFDWDMSSDANLTAFSYTLNNDVAGSNTQYLLYLDNLNDGGTDGVTESLLVLDNSDTNEAVTDGILFVDAGGGFTDYIDTPSSVFKVDGTGVLTAAGGTFNGNVDMTNDLILNIGDANTDFTAGGGLNIAGTLDVNGNLAVADTDIAFDGASTTFTVTGAFTLNTGGAITIGDGGDTVEINSSDWDISTTGAITGVSFDANGAGNSLSNVENADLANDTLDLDKVAAALTLDEETTISAGGALNLLIGNNVTLTTTGTGQIIATDLSCTDCIGTTEIADVYLLNTGDSATGSYTFTLGAAELITLDAATTDSTGTTGVLDLNLDTTSSQQGINIDAEVIDDNAVDTVAGITVLGTQSSDDGDNLYGVHVQNLAGSASTGNEYGIYQAGTAWDFGLYVEDAVHFNSTLNVVGNADFRADLADSTGNLTLNDAVDITGITTATGNINANGGLDVDDVFVVADGGALTTTGTASFNNVNAAGGSSDSVTLSGTLGAFDGSDTFRGIYLNYTNADHAGASNTFYGVDVANITGDAQATETAINIGTGWDNLLTYNGTPVINGLGQIVSTQISGTLFTITDGSTPQTIVQGDTLTYADSTTINAATSATDTVTLNVIADSITDTELAFNTGQNLTTSSTPTFAGLTLNGNLDMTNDLILNIGDANTDFTAGGGLTLAGTLDANGNVSIADTDIAFDGASTTFTVTGAYTLNTGGAITIGDGGDTIEINSSDWDISTTGAITGVSFDANGAGNSLSNVDNADLTNDTIDLDKVSASLTLDEETTISAGGALNLLIGNNVTLTTTGTGQIIASDLVCTDCIGTTEIADVYLLNSGDSATGSYTFTLGAAEVFQVDAASTPSTTTNGAIDLNFASLTDGFEGINIDLQVDDDAGSDTIIGQLINIDDNGNTANDTVYGLYIDAEDSGNTNDNEVPTALLALDNSDTNDVVGSAISIISAGGGFTNYISAPNFVVSGAGAITTGTIPWGSVTSQPNIVSSVDGVTNDEADVDFVATGNISITPDDTANTITFDVPTGAGANIFSTIDTPAGTDPVADTASDTLQLLATGTNLTITGADDPESVTFDISETTLAGNGLSASGDALVVNVSNGLEINADNVRVDEDYNFAFTGQHSYTNTITNSGSFIDLNPTLGNDADADTISAINIDATSVDTGADSDVLIGMNISNLSGGNANVTETAISVGTGWDNIITSANFSVTQAGAATAATLNTGQGANELYAMDQNVTTTSNVSFNNLTVNGQFVLGDGGETGAVNTSDWDIDATGAITGVSFDANGAGNSISNIDNADLTNDTLNLDKVSASLTLDEETTISAGGALNLLIGNNVTLTTTGTGQIIATDLSCTDCIGTTEIADVYLLNSGDTATGSYTFTLGAAELITLDAAATDSTGTTGVLDLNLDTTSSQQGINVDAEVIDDDAVDTVAGITVLGTQSSDDGDHLYGLHVQNLGGSASTGNEYGIYQAGTAWDYGLYVEDDALFNTGVTVNGTLDSNGNVSIADTDIAFDGASTTFTVTGAFTLNTGGSITIGDGGDTVAINSSDWDIDATGAITGVSFDANGVGNSLSNVDNADLSNDTLNLDKISASLTLDEETTISAGGALNLLIGNNVTLTTTGTGQIIATDLSCTDCIGTTEIADVYLLNSGDSATGSYTFALGAGELITLDAATTDSTGTSGILDLNLDTTSSQQGVNIDAEVVDDDAVDTVAGITVLGTQSSDDGDNLYGVHVQNLGGSASSGNEYGIYQAGTAWDFGLYVEDAAHFNTTVNVVGTLDARGDISDSTGNLTLNDAVDISGTTTFAGTLDANGQVDLGDNGDTFSVDSTAFDVTTAGAVSGVTTLSLSGNISDSDSAVTVADDFSVTGNTTIGDANTDTLTINAGSSGAGISFADGSFANCSALETVSGVLTCGVDADSNTLWNNIGDPSGNGSIAMGETVQTLDWNMATDVALNALSITLTNDVAGSNAQNLLYLDNADDAGAAGVTESLLVLDNSDANEAVTDGILFADGGGGFTDFIDTPSSVFKVSGSGALTAAGGTFNGNIDMTNDLILNIGDANTDFTAGGGLTLAGTLDANGNVSIADTDIAFDGDSTTFTLTGAFTVNTGGAITIGDGGDTVEINSSDWDISTTGAVTGVSFDANGAGNSLSNVDNADLTNDTIDLDKVAAGLTLDEQTTISAGGALNLLIGNNVTLTTTGTGQIIASDLVCTDCIGTTEIADVYLLNSGDSATGSYSFTLGAAELITLDAAATDSTGTTGVLDLNLDTTSSQQGINVDAEVIDDNAVDTVAGITVLGTQSSDDGDHLYGLHIQNLGGTASTGNEYGIYQAGTAWDYGLYVEDDALFNTGLTVNGTLDSNGNVSIADTDIAFDGASTTFTVTGAFTLNTGGAIALGDGGDTVAINSSDWDIDATGAITGVAFDANGAGNSLSNVDNADLTNDTLNLDKVSASLTLDEETTISAGGALNLLIGNNVTLTTTGTGQIIATDLSCTDCIGATEIADVYLLNTGDAATGAYSFTLGAAEAITVDAAATDSTLTTGVIDLNIDTTTAANIGLNIDYAIKDAGADVTSAYAEKLNITVDTDAAQSQTAYGLYINGANNDATSTLTALYVDAGTGAGTEYAAAFTNGNVGIGDDTLADATFEVEDNVAEQFRLGYDNTNYASFGISATGDITVNPTGGQVLYGDGDTFNIGGVSGLAYNAMADSGSTGHGLASDDDLFIGGDLEVNGSTWFDGPVTLGDATSDDVVFTGYVASNILPKTDDTYDLGDNTHRWQDLYLGPQTLHIGTSTVDEATLSYTTATNTLLLDNTASGIINIGTTALQQVITLGNSTGNTSIGLTTGGTGDITLTSADDFSAVFAAGSQFTYDATVDNTVNTTATGGIIQANIDANPGAGVTQQGLYIDYQAINDANADQTFRAFRLDFTNSEDAAGDTSYAFSLNNANDASGAALDALMTLENNDANTSVGDGILFLAGGANAPDFSDGIDFDAADFTRELVLENGEAIINQADDTIVLEDDGGTDYLSVTLATTTVAGDLVVSGNDISFGNGEAIDNSTTNGTIAFTTNTAGTDTVFSLRYANQDATDYGVINIMPKTSANNPSTCTEGDLYINTNSDSIFACTATDTWEALDGGTSLFTDAAGFTYLTDTAEDLVLGGSTTAAAKFWMDVSASTLFLGTDGVANGVLTLYSSGTETDPTISAEADGDLTLSAPTGTVNVGSGSGAITMSLTSAADLFTATHTGAIAATYTSSDYTFTRNMSNANSAHQFNGPVLKVTDTSTVVASSTINTGNDLLQVADSRTIAVGSVTYSGNLMDLNRSLTIDGAGSLTLTVNSPVASISDNCTTGVSDTCTHSGDVLRLTQDYASSTGAALNIDFGGADAGFALRVNDDGTASDSTAFVIMGTGNVGVGDVDPAALFTVGTSDAFQIDSAGRVGMQTTPNTNYLINIASDSTDDWDRVLSISHANNADESSTVFDIANSATLGTLGADRTVRNINSTMTPSGTTNNTFDLDARSIESYIGANSVTLGAGASSGILEGLTINIDGSPVYNSASGADDLTTYGAFSSVAITPTLTSVTASSGLTTIGGYFKGSAVSAGSANLTATTYGIYADAGGNLTTTGTTAHYGIYVHTVDGSAVNNYGLYVEAPSGATNNYAAIFAGGNVGIGSTSPADKLTVQADANPVNAGDYDTIGQFAVRGSTASTKMLRLGVDTTSDFAWIQSAQDGTNQRPLLLNPDGGGIGIGTTTTSDGRVEVNSGSSNALFLEVANGSPYSMILRRTDLGSGSDVSIWNDAGRFEIDDQLTISIDSTASIALCHGGANGSEADATLTDCNGGPTADYAELYPVEQGAEFGEIVAIGDEVVETKFTRTDSKGNILEGDMRNVSKLVKSRSPYQKNILGITSQNWADFSSTAHGSVKDEDNPLPIALSGRVTVKVNLENGPIKKGDYVTSSSIAGVGMKATQPGQMVGKALVDYNGGGDGKIMVFVNVVYADPANVLANMVLDSEGKIAMADVKTSSIKLDPGVVIDGQTVSGNLNDALAAITNNLNSTASKISQLNTDSIATASKLETIDSKIDALALQEASNSALIADTQRQTNLLSDAVVATSSNLASLASQIQDLMASFDGSSSTDSGALADSLTSPDVMTATDSATLADVSTSEPISTADISAQTIVASTSLKSLGQTYLGQTTIAGDLVVDGTFSVSNGSEINALPVLKLQTSALAEAVDFFNGLVTIDKTGSIIAKTVTVAEFKVVADKISGNSKIPLGAKTITVNNPLVKQSSRILITPTTETELILAVTKKTDGQGFTVSMAQPQLKDIYFDWWMVDEVRE